MATTLSKKRLYDLAETPSGAKSYIPQWWYVDITGKKVRKAEAGDPMILKIQDEPPADEIPKPKAKKSPRKKSSNAE